MSSDSNIIDEYFVKENFIDTNWAQESIYKAPKMESLQKELATCVACNKLIVNCKLEDSVQGFSDDSYFPLNTCMKCINSSACFVMCFDCTKKKAICPNHRFNNVLKSVQRQLFQFLISIRYMCKYCGYKEFTPR